MLTITRNNIVHFAAASGTRLRSRANTIQTSQTNDLLDGASAPSLVRVRPALNDLFDDLDPAVTSVLGI